MKNYPACRVKIYEPACETLVLTGTCIADVSSIGSDQPGHPGFLTKDFDTCTHKLGAKLMVTASKCVI